MQLRNWTRHTQKILTGLEVLGKALGKAEEVINEQREVVKKQHQWFEGQFEAEKQLVEEIQLGM